MNEKKDGKFKMSTKLWFYAGGLLGLLVFIAISAVWDLILGKFNFQDFVADTLILIAIALATMVLSDLFSSEANMNRVYGVYNISLNDYMEAMAKIDAIKIYFSQWYFWFLTREIKSKRENYLVLHGIEGTDARKIVAYADVSDVENMHKCEKKYIKTLFDETKVVLPKLATEEQVKAVYSVLKGEQDIKESNPSAYLFADDEKTSNMSTLERLAYLEKRRKGNKRRAYIIRIISLVLTSLLAAALIPATEEEGNGKNKWWLFCKRLGVFATSFISGWLAGNNDVVAKAAAIRDKTDKLERFYDCYSMKLWQPKTTEELDKEIIEQYEKEQEEARSAVVVEQPNDTKLLLGGNQQ